MGNDSVASAAGSHPRHRLFGQATPGPTPHPMTGSRSPGQEDPGTRSAKSGTNPLTQRGFAMSGSRLMLDLDGDGPDWVDLCYDMAGGPCAGSPAHLGPTRMP
jgi:hypothetical protein